MNICSIILPKTRQLKKYLNYIKCLLIFYILLLIINLFTYFGDSFKFISIIIFFILIIIKRYYYFAVIATLWIFVDVFLFFIRLGILVQVSSKNIFLYVYFSTALILNIISIFIFCFILKNVCSKTFLNINNKISNIY